MRIHHRLFLAALLCLAALLPARAQTDDIAVRNQPAPIVADRAPYRLVYDPTTGIFELYNQRDRLLERWDTRRSRSAVTPLVDIPPDRPIQVEIRNANPLLYEYSVEVQPMGLRDVASCFQVGRRFGTRGFLTAVSAISGGGFGYNPGDVTGALYDFFELDLDPQLAQRGETVSEEVMEQTLANLKRPLQNYLTFASTVNVYALSLEDSLARIADLAEVQPLDSLIERLQQRLERFEPGFSDPAKVPQIVTRRTQQILPQRQTLAVLANAIKQGHYEGDAYDPAAVDVLELEAQIDTTLETLQASLRELQQQLLTMEQARQEARTVFVTGPSGDVRRIAITALGNGEYGSFRLREGTVEIYTQGETALTCSFLVGVAWLPAAPEYTLDRNDLLVDNANGELTNKVNLGFEIAPTGFPLGLMAGLGLGDKAPDFYLGGTFRLFEPVILSGGVSWRRMARLPGPYEIGDLVTDPDFLDRLDKNYRPTYFFGLSFAN